MAEEVKQKTVKEALRELEEATEKLHRLFADKQPGLATWHIMLLEAGIEMRDALKSLGFPWEGR